MIHHRIQIIEVLKLVSLLIAVEVLLIIRTRFSEFNLGVLARQKEKDCDGEYPPLSFC